MPRAASCRPPSALPGLPLTTSCPARRNPSLRTSCSHQNTGTSPLTYKFELKATGSGGTTVETLKVKVAVGAGQPWPTASRAPTSVRTTGATSPMATSPSAEPSIPTSACDVSAAATNGHRSMEPGRRPSLLLDLHRRRQQGIGGSEIIHWIRRSLQRSSSGLRLFSLVASLRNLSANFLSHITSNPTFTAGTAQSVWPSESGGTYTFDWIYP